MAFDTKQNITKSRCLIWIIILLSSISLGYAQTFDGAGTGVSTDWAEPTNWEPEGIPGSTADIIIAADCNLDISRTIGSLTVNSGVTLDLSGNDLHNNGITTVDGTITLGIGSHTFIGDISVSSTGTINANSSSNSFAGNINFDASATLNEGTATWIFPNENAYVVTLGTNRSFDKIEHSPSTISGSRTLEFTGGTATILTSYTRSGRSQGTIGTLSYDSAALIYSPSGVAMTVDEQEWPDSGAPENVTFSGSNQLTLGFDKTVTGTFTLNQTANNFVVSGGNILTINGTLERKTSGTIGIDADGTTTGSVEYAATGSMLRYNSAANTEIGDEWPASSSPENVEMTITGSANLSAPGAGGLSRTIDQDLTINVGTLDLNSGTLTVTGSVIGSVIAGSATIDDETTLLIGNGAGTNESQSIIGSLILNKLTIDKSGGNSQLVTMNGSSSLDFTSGGTLTITNGTFNLNGTGRFTTPPATLTLNSGVLQTGGTSLTSITSLSAASGTIVFNGTSSAENLPTDVTIGTVEINNTNGVSATTGVLTIGNLLTFTNGTVTTSSSNLLRIGIGASTSGASSASYVNGPLQKAFASGNQSFTFPVGYNPYLEATFEYLTNNVATSIIQVRSVQGDPGGTLPSGISDIATSHYYVVTEVGTGGIFTYNFTGTFTGTGFSPDSRNQLIVQSGTGPVYNYPHTIAQTIGATTVKINDALGALPVGGIIALGAGGAFVTWDGDAGNGLWSSPTNWSSDAVPTGADEVSIDGDGVMVTIGGTTSATAQSLTIGGGTGTTTTLVINTSSTSPLTVTNALTINSDGKLTFNAANGDISAGSTDFTSASMVEYQARTIPVDDYGHLIINGATGISGVAGTTTVAGNLVKNGTAFTASGSYPISVSGTYTNTAGTPNYNGGLTVNGSPLTITSGGIDGTLILSGTSAQVIAGTASNSEIANLTINNANGVTLNKPVLVSGTVTLSSGLLTTTSSNLLEIGSSGDIIGSGSTKYINGPLKRNGAGTLFFPLGNSGDYRPVELLTVSGTNTAITFEMITGNSGGSADGTSLINISNVRYWHGSLSGGSLSNCKVRLYWAENDNVDGSLGNLAVATSPSQGGTYSSAGSSGIFGSSSSGYVSSSDLSDMQYFTLGDIAGDNSLPVELVSFQIKPDFNKVLIEWKTASESENLGYNLYRKLASKEDWTKINEELIPGQGNTSAETNYQFTDEHVQAGLVYSYKLESISYSGVIAVEKIVDIALPLPKEFVLYNNYPNPFNPLTHIKFQIPEFSRVTIAVFDITGKLVKTLLKDANYEAGSYITEWDATNQFGNEVSSGIYFYRFTAGNFSSLGRMVLLK